MSQILKNKAGFHASEFIFLLMILVLFFGFLVPALNQTEQEKKDQKRISDLMVISEALEGYYQDYGQYPPMPQHGLKDGCLAPLDESDAGEKSTVAILGDYLNPENLPKPPEGQVVLGCKDAYYYRPISQGGIKNQSYVLATYVDTPVAANFQMPFDEVSPEYFDESDEAQGIIKKLVQIDHFSKNNAAFYVVIP